jgi:predicted DNA-binding protein
VDDLTPAASQHDPTAVAPSILLCRLSVYMKTTTIRVPAETRDRLNALARRRGTPAGEIVAELVREADDRALLADAEESWQRVAADQTTLAAYRAEAEELSDFDATPPAY